MVEVATGSSRKMSVREAQKESVPVITERIEALDWSYIAARLDTNGCAVISLVLSPEECKSLAVIYEADERFRSRTVMARHGFGRGEYVPVIVRRSASSFTTPNEQAP